MWVCIDVIEECNPCFLGNDEIEKSLDHVVGSHFSAVAYEVFTNFLCYVFRLFLSHFDEWEDHESEITLKLCSCLLQLCHLLRHFLTVEFLDGFQYCLLYFLFYYHLSYEMKFRK